MGDVSSARDGGWGVGESRESREEGDGWRWRRTEYSSCACAVSESEPIAALARRVASV